VGPWGRHNRRVIIQIHFTPADLAKVSFPAEPEPLWEAALAARALGDRAIPPVARRWRRQAVPLIRPSMRPLFKLIAPAGQFPDFLTPEVPSPGLDAAIEVLMDAPADLVQDELRPWLPAVTDQFMQGLLAGKAGSRRALGNAVRAFHQEVLAPAAAELERHYGADLAIRARSLLHGGVDELLGHLHPDITWSAPTLTTYGAGGRPCYEAFLNGRGLQLYPSPFTAECMLLDMPDRRPVLVYPCAELPLTDVDDTDALADLLGRTRAAVLRALTASASTTQLARRTGISLASASEHARVLRNAGLITTHRTAGTAHHSLTPAAQTLLTTPTPRALTRLPH